MRVGVLHEEPAEASRLSVALVRAGHKPVAFTNGLALNEALGSEHFDLLLMRWDGEALSGVALMHRLRARLAAPPSIVMLVDKATPGGIADGADLVLNNEDGDGALTEALSELAGRQGNISPRVEQFDDLQFDRNTAQVLVRGHAVLLTAKEFALALLLMRHVGQALSRDHIMAAVWSRQDQPGSRTLDAHIAQVRKHLTLRPEHGWRLSSVYGFGYRLDRVDPPN